MVSEIFNIIFLPSFLCQISIKYSSDETLRIEINIYHHAVVASWRMMRPLLLLHTIIFLCKRPSSAVAAVRMCTCARESSEMMIWLDAPVFGSSHSLSCLHCKFDTIVCSMCARAPYAICKLRAEIARSAG
jgi:hypothetical protein